MAKPKTDKRNGLQIKKKSSCHCRNCQFCQRSGGGGVPEMVVCNTCERLFKGQAGLTLHCRRAHPVDFHNEHQVLPRVKARWAPEEVRRMAEFESSLLLSGVKPIAINSQLVEKFPDRSRESIKG